MSTISMNKNTYIQMSTMSISIAAIIVPNPTRLGLSSYLAHRSGRMKYASDSRMAMSKMVVRMRMKDISMANVLFAFWEIFRNRHFSFDSSQIPT